MRCLLVLGCSLFCGLGVDCLLLSVIVERCLLLFVVGCLLLVDVVCLSLCVAVCLSFVVGWLLFVVCC